MSSRPFKEGRRDGQKGDIFGSVFKSLGHGMTSAVTGSKTASEYNKGNSQGWQDRRQGNRPSGKKRW